jgi:glutathione S-transferase
VKLYDNDLDPGAYTARLMLSLLGLPCQRVLVDRFPGNEDPPVPVLEDGGARPRGTAAVLTHLAARYAPGWLPADPAAGDSWLSSLTDGGACLSQARLLALFTAGGPRAGLVAEAARSLREMDDHLTMAELDGISWFAGSRPSIVDVAAFAPACLSTDYGVEHDAFPALRRWIRRFRALPGFITMPGIPQFY